MLISKRGMLCLMAAVLAFGVIYNVMTADKKNVTSDAVMVFYAVSP